MYAEIVSIGHELLMGEIVDTNASYFAARLSEVGITVRWTGIVGDDLDDLYEACTRASKRAEVLITTGGLGPTSDDLTREAVARVMGEKLSIDQASLRWLEGAFEKRGIEMPRTNIKQAMLIPSATTVPNNLGTAPGWWVQRDGRHIILLPGPPRENRRMWDETVGPRLARISGAGVVVTRTLKTAGITEGGIDEMLSSMFGRDNPYLGIYARPDGIHLRMIARAPDESSARALIGPMEEEIRRILGAAIWGADEETPGHRALALLTARGLTLGTFEGVSGGALAGQLVRVPGHARAYCGSLVTGADGEQHAGRSSVLRQALLSRLGHGSAAAGRGRGMETSERDSGQSSASAGSAHGSGHRSLAEDLPTGASEQDALGLAQAARDILGADVGVATTAPAPENAADPEGTYRVAIVGPRGEQIALGKVSYALEVTMERAATLALVELVAALSRDRI